MEMIEIKMAAMWKRNGKFWGKVGPGHETDCWIWKGNYHGAMPRFRDKSAARFAYEYIHGYLPKDKIIRQTCGDNRCMNPWHMLSKKDGNASRLREQY